uniref:Uncharacterized protein n=1 Tax=Rhipicephalus zambeziensis TaxID=60191 RepID=A0A224Y7M4_9ACAR
MQAVELFICIAYCSLKKSIKLVLNHMQGITTTFVSNQSKDPSINTQVTCLASAANRCQCEVLQSALKLIPGASSVATISKSETRTVHIIFRVGHH